MKISFLRIIMQLKHPKNGKGGGGEGNSKKS
jgi:hypothetical protein